MSQLISHDIKDITLADQGYRNIEWAEVQMGALLRVRERFTQEKPLAGLRVGMALHITKETAVLVKTLIAGGAEVAITSCNPLTTQDDAAAALADSGVNVYGYKGESRDEYYRYIREVVSFRPHITVDDGCDLVSEIHTRHTDQIPEIVCGCEETRTGVIRLQAMERDGALQYPMIAVDDCLTKHLMDNYYGTGQSALDGIIRASNVLLSGKTVVVAGYGNCGKGVAMRAGGMGANVIVTEVDAFRALQAKMDGHRVMKMDDAAPLGDIFITSTGDRDVIVERHMRAMTDGAILANAGHFDIELDMEALHKLAGENVREIRPLFHEYGFDGKVLFVCGEGRLVNLACAEGHPSAVMALSFCDQALGMEWGVKHRDELEPKVYQLPHEIDGQVARLQLEAMGVEIDSLTPEQQTYLNSWDSGT